MRIALITGASSGLGREYIRCINRSEKRIDEIWAVARRKERLDELAAEAAVRGEIPVRAVPADLLREEDLSRIEGMLAEEKPEVGILINAAGFGKIGNYEQVGRRASDRMIDLNCRAAVDMTYICLPYMKKGGRIMEICSTAGFQPFQDLDTYAASKAFLYRWTRALRVELLGRGIKVTAVCPYWIKDTEFIPVAKETEGDGAAIRHFPLASKVSSVAKISLANSRIGMPVSTPGIMCTAHRIAAKFIPAEFMMGIWELLRRV